MTVYSADADGYYTVPARAMICSTGTATPTSGTYSLPGNRWEWKGLFGDVYGQYATHITGNILFHSVPYTKNRDKSSLEYWEFDKLGTAASMGCIRMQVRDAKWVYDNMFSIQAVQFYKDADPGPLGKPSAPKISGNETCRGWDPTDPGSGNPWNSQPSTLTVADYVGMAGDAAGEQAKDAGLVPETVTADSDMPEGTVIGQSIEPGTTVDFGSTIVLTVSSGQAPADEETPEPDNTEEPGDGDDPAPTEPEEPGQP